MKRRYFFAALLAAPFGGFAKASPVVTGNTYGTLSEEWFGPGRMRSSSSYDPAGELSTWESNIPSGQWVWSTKGMPE